MPSSLLMNEHYIRYEGSWTATHVVQVLANHIDDVSYTQRFHLLLILGRQRASNEKPSCVQANKLNPERAREAANARSQRHVHFTLSEAIFKSSPFIGGKEASKQGVSREGKTCNAKADMGAMDAHYLLCGCRNHLSIIVDHGHRHPSCGQKKLFLGKNDLQEHSVSNLHWMIQRPHDVH